jgi:hypothetical protein
VQPLAAPAVCNVILYEIHALHMLAAATASGCHGIDDMQGIGRLGSVDASLIPNPKPGLRSNAASTPSTPTAAPPFDAYSQGSLNYPLLNRFFERDGYTPVSYSCSGAGKQLHFKE